MIGAGLCNALINRGDQVIGLSRNPDKARQAQPTAEWYGWEPTMGRPPAEALDAADAVINLAGEPINQRWNDEVKDRIARSRIKATKNLAEAIATAEAKPEIFISGSAIGYYGDRGDDLLYEDAEPGDDFLADVVVKWEEAADSVAESGLRVAKIRTGHVLDPRGGPRVEGTVGDEVAEGERSAAEAADGDQRTVNRQRRQHHIDARAVGQPRVDQRRGVVDATTAGRDEPDCRLAQLGRVAEA